MFFSFSQSKICYGGTHQKCFFRKKNVANLYMKRFVYFPLNNSPETFLSKRFREKWFQCVLNVMFLQFLFIHKAFSARVCFYEVAKILRCFVFALVWNLVFMYKGSQPRIYADLHSFLSSIHNSTHEDYNFIFHSFFSCSCTCF